MGRAWRDGEARAELITAFCMMALSAAVWVAADRLPPPIFDPLGSAAVPKLVAVVVALLAVAMLGQRQFGTADRGALHDTGDPAEAEGEAVAPLRPGIAFGAFAAMALCPAVMAAGLLGFRETSFVFILALGGILSHFSGRTMMILVPTAAVLAVGLSRLFGGMLYVDLPQTPWLPF
ncbi:MAG: tripartite tricarboxylate transporter TctB family protein [Pseudomonadota bacterium]|nr:tripartite tricarboxylate transporter TctB family protein [Pseudomonadota bacterium]